MFLHRAVRNGCTRTKLVLYFYPFKKSPLIDYYKETHFITAVSAQPHQEPETRRPILEHHDFAVVWSRGRGWAKPNLGAEITGRRSPGSRQSRTAVSPRPGRCRRAGLPPGSAGAARRAAAQAGAGATGARGRLTSDARRDCRTGSVPAPATLTSSSSNVGRGSKS